MFQETDCGTSFHAQHGPTTHAEEVRCEKCDYSVLIVLGMFLDY